MCRIFGCVATTPVDIEHELIGAENPLIRQSEQHDSGWGMAVYPHGEGEQPQLVRFPKAAYEDAGFRDATGRRGRIFNVHVRRATLGGLTLANTHPFSLAGYSFGHNGTVLGYAGLQRDGVARAAGETDSEHLFNFLLHDLDPDDVVGSLRRMVTEAAALGPFSGLNLLFCDGERLYAYKLGIFKLHWLARPGQLLVASEMLTSEPWHSVGQDVLLTLDPGDPAEPHAERLVGDSVVEECEILKFEEGSELRGAARGAFAAERAARLAPSE